MSSSEESDEDAFESADEGLDEDDDEDIHHQHLTQSHNFQESLEPKPSQQLNKSDEDLLNKRKSDCVTINETQRSLEENNESTKVSAFKPKQINAQKDVPPVDAKANTDTRKADPIIERDGKQEEEKQKPDEENTPIDATKQSEEPATQGSEEPAKTAIKGRKLKRFADKKSCNKTSNVLTDENIIRDDPQDPQNLKTDENESNENVLKHQEPEKIEKSKDPTDLNKNIETLRNEPVVEEHKITESYVSEKIDKKVSFSQDVQQIIPSKVEFQESQQLETNSSLAQKKTTSNEEQSINENVIKNETQGENVIKGRKLLRNAERIKTTEYNEVSESKKNEVFNKLDSISSSSTSSWGNWFSDFKTAAVAATSTTASHASNWAFDPKNLLSSAASLTSHVVENVSSVIGAPSPEDLAASMHHETQTDSLTENKEETKNPDTNRGTPNTQKSGFGLFDLTLDTLELIGKKTIEVIDNRKPNSNTAIIDKSYKKD